MQKKRVDAAAFIAVLVGTGMNIVGDQFPKWIGWALIGVGVLWFVWRNIPEKWPAWGKLSVLGVAFVSVSAAFCYLSFFYKRAPEIGAVKDCPPGTAFCIRGLNGLTVIEPKFHTPSDCINDANGKDHLFVRPECNIPPSAPR
ncbi:MAG: hypothetical protein ABSF96_04525 [Steroidobacteraceae bacterium]